MKREALITSTATPRIEFLDFIKGIAIICIIAGHSGQGESLHRTFVFSFHLPIFFIITGFLFAESNLISLRFVEIAYKKFRRLILPYLTAALIIVLLTIVTSFYTLVTTFYSLNHNLIISIKHSIFMLTDVQPYLVSLCYGSGKRVLLSQSVIQPVAMLWFLPSLFSANIIFYFFLKLFEKYSLAIQSIIIILLTFAGYMIGKHIFLPWSIDISLVAQVFVFSGYLMQKYKIYEKKAPLLLFIAAAGIWFLDLYMGGIGMNDRVYNNLAVSTIGAIAASYLIMKLSYFLSKRTSFYYKSVAYIGRQSLVILCFSLSDILIFPPVIKFLALEWLYQNKFWILLTGLRLCYSLIIAEVIKLIPFLKFVYYPKTSRIIER